jgi:hypothetical protein
MDVRSTRARRLVFLLVACAALLVPSLAAAPGAAGAPPSGCRTETCTAYLRVGGTPAKWRSNEVFYPQNERLYADLSTGKRPLALVRSYGAELCRHRFAGGGIKAVVTACGTTTRIRVRAVSTKGKTRHLRIDYAATAAMGDGPAPAPPPPTGTGSNSAADILESVLKPITGLLGL